MNTPKTRLTLLGIACGILLALLVAPQTRWLVRMQLFPLSLLPGHYNAQVRSCVAAHPDDYQIQLAGMPDNSPADPSANPRLAYDRSLVPHFPNSASLRANILRYATDHEVRLNRDEDFLMAGESIAVRRADPLHPPPTPAHLAAFDADAAAGERLDPDNAYFPFMRALGLFAAHRDSEAMAEIQRASTKHIWQEYYHDEVEGRWRINKAIYGGQEALSAGAVSASVLFPQYEYLRALARVVVWKAILDEKAGHPEAGLAKREALGRCGEIMAVRSTTLIGNLVGIAINTISRSRPGGVPPLKYDSRLSGEQRLKKHLEVYCAYVTKIGHPEAAEEARADMQTGEQIRQITSRIGDYVVGIRLSEFTRMGIALAAGWAVLPNLLSFFLLGLAAAVLSRLPQIRAGHPLPVGAAIGFWSVLLTGLALIAVFIGSDASDFLLPAVLVALTLPICFGLLALLLPRLRRPIAAGFMSAAVTAGVVGLIALLVGWQAHESLGILSSLSGSYTGGNWGISGLSASQTALVQILILVLLVTMIPLLFALVGSIVSRVKRVPVSVGLVNGFRSVMPPLVCALMLVYGGLTLWTVKQEARANYGLARSLHGEGQYLAEMTGQAWPKG